MTVSADRGIRFSSAYQYAMDPFPEILLNPFVALAASFGYVEMIDGRFLLSRRQNLMGGSGRGVAIITGRSHIDPTFCCLAVYAALIDLDRMIDQYFILFS